VTFGQPLFLLALVAVPLLAAGYLLAQQRRRRYTLRFTDLPLLGSVAARGPGLRRHVPPAVFLFGLGGLLLGLAGPVLNLEVARNNSSVMLVIDVSGSMAATDVQPTRLDAARSAARTLIDKLPANTRIGLISFNGSATVNAALSDDRQSVAAALDGLQPGGSTAIGDALSLAVGQLAPGPAPASGVRRQPAMIVLLTDGASNRGVDPLTAANRARAAGIQVMTVGIGVRNGTVLVHGQDVGGVDEQTLQSIATATGGKYFYAEAAGQLNQIYNTLGSQFGWQFLRLDITLPTLLIGVLAVLVAAGISLLWFRVLP
jgi:Ca-activated chloride channel family protein